MDNQNYDIDEKTDEKQEKGLNTNEDSDLTYEEFEAQENAKEEEEKLKNKNAAAMLYGAETNPKMAEEFLKVQETHESLKEQNQKIANAINDVAETMESEERKTSVTGRRDPRMARSQKFIKVDWKPNEISNKAETLSANKDFKDNFIKTADELLGAGRFLWTGSEQYKQLKESVKACKQLMEKQGKMDPVEYNKQLQEHMETIIGKAGNYLKYKSQYAGKDEELKKQSSTAQSRYTAANKMWNLLVDQKKELEVYNAFSERRAIETERADRKIKQAEKTIKQAEKTAKQAEKTIKQKTVQTMKTTVEKPQTTAEQPKSSNVADKDKLKEALANNLKAAREMVHELETKSAENNPEVQAKINDNLRFAYKEQGKMEISNFEQNKRMASNQLRYADSPEKMQHALAKLIMENHNQTMVKNQLLEMNKLSDGERPSKLSFMSEEQIEQATKVLANNPRLKDKCNELFGNPEKMNGILCDHQHSKAIEKSKNISDLTQKLEIKIPAPEPSKQVVKEAPEFSMGMQ